MERKFGTCSEARSAPLPRPQLQPEPLITELINTNVKQFSDLAGKQFNDGATKSTRCQDLMNVVRCYGHLKIDQQIY